MPTIRLGEGRAYAYEERGSGTPEREGGGATAALAAAKGAVTPPSQSTHRARDRASSKLVGLTPLARPSRLHRAG